MPAHRHETLDNASSRYVGGVIHLRGRGADVLIDESFGAPVIAYWGAPLGAVDGDSVVMALERATVPGGLDVIAPISVVPEHGSGFVGRPGLIGHRNGGRAPCLEPVSQLAADLGIERIDLSFRREENALACGFTRNCDNSKFDLPCPFASSLIHR